MVKRRGGGLSEGKQADRLNDREESPEIHFLRPRASGWWWRMNGEWHSGWVVVHCQLLMPCGWVALHPPPSTMQTMIIIMIRLGIINWSQTGGIYIIILLEINWWIMEWLERKLVINGSLCRMNYHPHIQAALSALFLHCCLLLLSCLLVAACCAWDPRCLFN